MIAVVPSSVGKWSSAGSGELRTQEADSFPVRHEEGLQFVVQPSLPCGMLQKSPEGPRQQYHVEATNTTQGTCMIGGSEDLGYRTTNRLPNRNSNSFDVLSNYRRHGTSKMLYRLPYQIVSVVQVRLDPNVRRWLDHYHRRDSQLRHTTLGRQMVIVDRYTSIMRVESVKL